MGEVPLYEGIVPRGRRAAPPPGGSLWEGAPARVGWESQSRVMRRCAREYKRQTHSDHAPNG